MGPFSALLVAAAAVSFTTIGPLPGGLPAPAAKALEKRWAATFDGLPTCGKLVHSTYDESLIGKAIGCNDDAKCLGKLGAGLGVKHLFVASVSKSLNGLRLSARAIDPDGVPRATFAATAATAGELNEKMPELAAKLCTAVTGIQPAASLDLDLDMGAPVAANNAGGGLDLDLDMGAAPPPKPAATPPPKPAAPVAALDLDLDVGSPAPAPAPTKPAPGKPAPAALDLDLDLGDAPPPAAVAKAPPGKPGKTPPAKPAAADLDFDLDLGAPPVAVAAAPKPVAPKPGIAPPPAAAKPPPPAAKPPPTAVAELPPLPPEVLEPVPAGPPAPVGAIVATVVTVLSGAGAAAAGMLVLGAQTRRDSTSTYADYLAGQAEMESMGLIANVGWGVAAGGAIASAVLWVMSGGTPPAETPAPVPAGTGGN